MDKYDKFLEDVSEKTGDGTLHWDVASPNKYQEYILQSPFVYSSFDADYKVGGKAYTLVFAEKKVPVTAGDFDTAAEQYRCELLVIKNHTLIFTLDENYVEYSELLELGNNIQSKNASAEELFGNFS